MSLGEVVEYLIECGHDKEKIFYDYTIDQLWLFYAKSVIIRRKHQHEDAILFANCIMLGNPYAGKEAGENFQKFLRSLLPDSFKKGLHDHEIHKMKEVRSKAPPEIHKSFQQMGMDFSVPMQSKAEKRKKKEKMRRRKEKPKPPKPTEDIE